jgi:hypothetical protein
VLAGGVDQDPTDQPTGPAAHASGASGAFGASAAFGGAGEADLDDFWDRDEFDPPDGNVPRFDADPGSRIDFAITRAEFADRDVARATAQRLKAVFETVRGARENPELFIPGDRVCEKDAVEFAVRGAVADLATALHVSQASIRAQAVEAQMLITRLPATWSGLWEGAISYPCAKAIVEHAAGLPDDGGEEAAAVWAEYDRKLAERAAKLPPARMREHARRLAEKLVAEPLQTRYDRAVTGRRVWTEAAPDGMSWLGALMPAAAAIAGMARVNAIVKHLKAQSGETRTLPQLRADILADLLAGKGTGYPVKADVAVTVPVLTAMGVDETGTPVDASRLRPGDLNGYGPIDPNTARRLAATAPSFHRILTAPVTSAILDLDRATYRPPADLKRWVRLVQPVCTFPGCGRLAADCDIDHSVDWARGGTTAATNLGPLCLENHRLKHKTTWAMSRNPDGSIHWTSPTGREHDQDPPPF